MITELLPCPFCGNNDVEIIEDDKNPYFKVKCIGCLIETGYHSTHLAAVKYWNRRAPQNQWIKCSDRLPKEAEVVLVTDGNQITLAFISHKYKWFQVNTYSELNDLVTHWMLCPKPPNL